MKYLIKKDKKKRNIVKKYELKRLVLKSIISDQNLNIRIRTNTYTILSNMNLNSSLVRVKNRCIVTGRSRFVFSKYKISRFTLKILFSHKRLAGFSSRI